MIQVASTVWNLVTALAFLVAAAYAYRLNRVFKGGKIAKANNYALLGFVVMFLTFLVSFIFNLAQFSPTTAYDISVKDLGVLISGVLIMLSLMEASRFWSARSPNPEPSK